MKKLEEDETIKDKEEQTRAANCTLPKKDKNVQKMPKTSQKCFKSVKSHKRNAKNVQKVNLKYVRLPLENMMLCRYVLQNGFETRSILTK